MSPEKDHISICVCTYKRPGHLRRLLNALPEQETGGGFCFSVVVVDNDRERTAENVVREIVSETALAIRYFNEPVQNIALARNLAVARSEGSLIAFIDDDEFPAPGWLSHLHESIHAYGVQGVLGPVKPFFVEEPPAWIVRGRICERSSFPSGTSLTDSRYTRTGNVLLSAAIFDGESLPFDPRFGKTGGEDVDFFKRMMARGMSFVWDDEAVVYEAVPPERMKRKYFLKRALLRGFVASRNPSVSGILKSMVAAGLYTVLLPALLLMGQHLFMKYLIKDCDHLGKLLGLCGIRPLTERQF